MTLEEVKKIPFAADFCNAGLRLLAERVLDRALAADDPREYAKSYLDICGIAMSYDMWETQCIKEYAEIHACEDCESEGCEDCCFAKDKE